MKFCTYIGALQPAYRGIQAENGEKHVTARSARSTCGNARNKHVMRKRLLVVALLVQVLVHIV